MKVDAATLAVLIGVVLPLLTGIVTKANASSSLKAVINAGLSAIAGFLVAVVPGSKIEWRDVVLGVGLTWAISVATYYGLWKPTGTARSVAMATSKFGLGSSD